MADPDKSILALAYLCQVFPSADNYQESSEHRALLFQERVRQRVEGVQRLGAQQIMTQYACEREI